MTRKITFNELRKIKDSLPDGAVRKLATEFGVEVETVRNYFGGSNYTNGKAVGIHMEPGPDGGVVLIDDDAILDRAQQLIAESV
jgi:hypothetical protein